MNFKKEALRTFVNNFIFSYPVIKSFLKESGNHEEFLKVINEYPGKLSYLPDNFEFDVYKYQGQINEGMVETELYFDGEKSDLTIKIDYRLNDDDNHYFKVYDVLVL